MVFYGVFLTWQIDPDNSNPRLDELFFVSLQSESYWGSTDCKSIFVKFGRREGGRNNGNCSIPLMNGIAIGLIPSLEEKGRIHIF